MANTLIQSEKLENILIVNGAENDYNTKMIKQGYDKVLKPLYPMESKYYIRRMVC